MTKEESAKFSRKLQRALIDAGSRVELDRDKQCMDISDMIELLIALRWNIVRGHMNSQLLVSTKLISELLRFQIEKL